MKFNKTLLYIGFAVSLVSSVAYAGDIASYRAHLKSHFTKTMKENQLTCDTVRKWIEEMISDAQQNYSQYPSPIFARFLSEKYRNKAEYMLAGVCWDSDLKQEMKLFDNACKLGDSDACKVWIDLNKLKK